MWIPRTFIQGTLFQVCYLRSYGRKWI